jgi:hypothetical protein
MEAINSMFGWYRDAVRCYVYLADLSDTSMNEELARNLASCRWLTRGWTLQELVAPEHVDFFNKDWELCFTESEAAVDLARLTRIDLDVDSRDRVGQRSSLPENDLGGGKKYHESRRHGLLPARDIRHQHAAAVRGERKGLHAAAGRNCAVHSRSKHTCLARTPVNGQKFCQWRTGPVPGCLCWRSKSPGRSPPSRLLHVQQRDQGACQVHCPHPS